MRVCLHNLFRITDSVGFSLSLSLSLLLSPVLAFLPPCLLAFVVWQGAITLIKDGEPWEATEPGETALTPTDEVIMVLEPSTLRSLKLQGNDFPDEQTEMMVEMCDRLQIQLEI